MQAYTLEHNRTNVDEEHLNDLALKMQRGDERAAETLYDALVERVFELCESRLHNTKSAEELTQEIFLRLINRIESFNAGYGDFSEWFWKLVRCAMFDYYHREKHL